MKKERLNPVLLVALLGLFAVGCSSASQSVPESPDLDMDAVRQAQQVTGYPIDAPPGGGAASVLLARGPSPSLFCTALLKSGRRRRVSFFTTQSDVVRGGGEYCCRSSHRLRGSRTEPRLSAVGQAVPGLLGELNGPIRLSHQPADFIDFTSSRDFDFATAIWDSRSRCWS